MTGIFTMTNTNTVNIHFFLHITRGVNQNQRYCAYTVRALKVYNNVYDCKVLDQVLVLELVSKMHNGIWTKDGKGPKVG